MLDIVENMVWVMHRSDPTLLRIDPRSDPPQVVKFLLPLPIEAPHGDGQRRVFVTSAGC